MDYNQMNYNMQQQSPMGLQTAEQKQMGMFLHLSQLLNAFLPPLGLLALVIMSIVFPIIGAVKANNGELWEYPLTIKFLK